MRAHLAGTAPGRHRPATALGHIPPVNLRHPAATGLASNRRRAATALVSRHRRAATGLASNRRRAATALVSRHRARIPRANQPRPGVTRASQTIVSGVSRRAECTTLLTAP